jgi:histidinol dehydrogenase
MPVKLHSKDADFTSRFEAFLRLRQATEPDVRETVANIIARVRREGDDALIALTQQFDRLTLEKGRLRLTQEVIQEAREACPPEVLDALALAAKRITDYHLRQLPKDEVYTDADGVTLGWRFTSLDAVGLYVPGGTASYPSSVLMNAIPARVAGVRRIAIVAPAREGRFNPAVLAAASLAGIEEIYPVGGAQAVAALAYGTESIRAVDKIAGPGNAYVAEAKRQVFGQVGIDMIAGPSEILVVADGKNDPGHIAADLLSQAEHDALAQSILMTDDADFAAKVEEAIQALLVQLSRGVMAGASWERYGGVILVEDLETQAPELVDRIAPEHVELAVARPEKLMARIRHAGAIFLGRHTPEAIGDYIAGPSHVLPTSRTARFSSGLGVLDFLKRSSIIGCTEESVRVIGGDAAILADAEGLPAHALSIRLRL